jgi:hypothetical protein
MLEVAGLPREFDLTTKHTKVTKNSGMIIFSFVLFATFVVKYPYRLWLRLAHGEIFGSLVTVRVILPA